MDSSLRELGSPLDLPGPSPRPVNLPQIESIDLKARYHSPRCGGDFFDAVAIGSRVVFLLMDIAGRRPETHPIAVQVQNVFRNNAQTLFEASDANESEGIASLARDINRAIIEAARGIRFAPAFLGCYNLTLNILTYDYAGHLLAVFQDAETARILEPGGIPLGLFTHSTYEPSVLAFDQHARLLLVTKGLVENRRGSATVRDEQIRCLLRNSTTDSASAICDTVLRAAREFENRPWSRVYDFFRRRNQSYRDDLTVVTLVRRSDSIKAHNSQNAQVCQPRPREKAWKFWKG
jgi:serine phosphatase RsbU (regulator of sigma subunit)